MTAELTSNPLTNAITKFTSDSENEGWFNYPVRVYPHHTDYAGVVWHGTYLTWMEEARVECLRTVGMSFEELVSAGVDLPVAEMNLRYHRSARMGDDVLVMTRLVPDKVRLNWEYQIRTETDLCVTAVVTLVPVDFEKRKLLRSLPSSLEGAIAKLTGI
ncbi:thioesterase family protein [Pseudanabaena galeata UHCC 0370]|jgi:acyl-CoA thioester hydrolase|uniref:Thioesterase family protein n=1 Tax=Pseudanabaena galeata UHCC 0370 TaxID=3110310 RepID=A0ABU5TP03_9CYAN|nr:MULTISPECIES: thioesterase family protein [Pseudanabaena]MEA5479718.1 thioesterase family protein [Pseudanabaena galeata UHCC 0370]MEA5486504.1 thioesterase family protein [Pseudanabaena sp. CCNP1317]WGS74189.1 thioesterase family protein [Pseudanabaena galeata CCNP1313]